MKTQGQNSWCCGRDYNQTPPEYKLRVVRLAGVLDDSCHLYLKLLRHAVIRISHLPLFQLRNVI
jgi:hypothetical protein